MTPITRPAGMSDQQYIQFLEQVISSKGQPKQPELRITQREGFVQLRHLTSSSINLPVHVIRWLLTNSDTVNSFLTNNANLLSERGDDEVTHLSKLQARQKAATDENSVVRKPRAVAQT